MRPSTVSLRNKICEVSQISKSTQRTCSTDRRTRARSRTAQTERSAAGRTTFSWIRSNLDSAAVMRRRPSGCASERADAHRAEQAVRALPGQASIGREFGLTRFGVRVATNVNSRNEQTLALPRPLFGSATLKCLPALPCGRPQVRSCSPPRPASPSAAPATHRTASHQLDACGGRQSTGPSISRCERPCSCRIRSASSITSIATLVVGIALHPGKGRPAGLAAATRLTLFIKTRPVFAINPA